MEAGQSSPNDYWQDWTVSFVAINVLTVPSEQSQTLESRFAARQGSVDKAPGFEHFELLRPLEGTDEYLVYTRWESRSHFDQWRQSREFTSGHSKTPRTAADSDDSKNSPAASAATLWTFEVV